MTKQPRKRALLLVDLQNGFCPGGNLAVPGGADIIPIANALMASGYYDVIVASQDWHPPGHGSFASTHGKAPFDMGELGGQPQVMWPDHCVQGTKDAEFHPDLDLSKIAFIQQKGQDPNVDSYSAFRDNAAGTNTGLDQWLIRQGVYLLDVCGLATDYCVKFSALDAKSMMPNLEIVRFIDDASRGIAPETVSDAVREMNKAGIEIIDSRTILSPTAYRSEYSFGENFHTALRKGSDTKFSAVLWNYINQLEQIEIDTKRRELIWPHFVKHCARLWVDGLTPSQAAKKWAAMRDDYGLRAEDQMPSTSAAITFALMVELCDQETWDDIDATIGFWVDEEESKAREALRASNG